MKKFLAYFIFVAIFGCIIASQLIFDQNNAKAAPTEIFIPDQKIMRLTDLGLHNVVSDIYWIMAIQYYGDSRQKDYKQLSQYLTLIIYLNPKASQPYSFGILNLPDLGMTDEAITLANKGLAQSEPDWEIPYYLAAVYHIYKNDPENAHRYFDLAANTKGAPDNIKYIAANYGGSPDKRSQSILIWQGIYDNATDPNIKERSKNYLDHLFILNLLDEASTKYQQKYNNLPQTVDDLVTGKILKSIPADPLGFQFEFDSSGKSKIK